ncbi:MAG TPA: hypothetical protein PK361_11860, partial [Chiayiivirga sp.]|nr:hypothetical protein [Chiayiivirga sp.]
AWRGFVVAAGHYTLRAVVRLLRLPMPQTLPPPPAASRFQTLPRASACGFQPSRPRSRVESGDMRPQPFFRAAECVPLIRRA